jgi:hypothetical protein
MKTKSRDTASQEVYNIMLILKTIILAKTAIELNLILFIEIIESYCNPDVWST